MWSWSVPTVPQSPPATASPPPSPCWTRAGPVWSSICTEMEASYYVVQIIAFYRDDESDQTTWHHSTCHLYIHRLNYWGGIRLWIVVGAEFLLVVVNPVSPIISQLQPPSRHSDISWSHHGDEGLRWGWWTGPGQGVWLVSNSRFILPKFSRFWPQLHQFYHWP